MLCLSPARLRPLPLMRAAQRSSTAGGFAEAQILVEGLRRAGPHLTRAGLIGALETLRDYNDAFVGPVTYTPTSHEGIRGAYIEVVRDGVLVPVTGYQYLS